MNKIALIIKREYLSRVRKKSFIIMTLLAPIFMGALITTPLLMDISDDEQKEIWIHDQSELFSDYYKNTDEIRFSSMNGSLDILKQDFNNSEAMALVHIPAVDITEIELLEEEVLVFTHKPLSFSHQRMLSFDIENCVETIKLKQLGISKAQIDSTQSLINLQTIILDDSGVETSGSTEIASGLSMAGGFLIYIFIFLYGAMVMRGVMEEKTSRIIEVIISSVKPFQLMMGKIVGVALVGFTQFALWILFTFLISTAASYFFISGTELDIESVQLSAELIHTQSSSGIQTVLNQLMDMNIPRLLTMFLFYFVGGYLMYGSLFAAVGAAVDSETDTQQFMMPITLPLIFSFIALQTILENPDSSLAFWCSIIPFTSPIVMMGRLPFDPPLWEIVLSMGLLIIGFIFTSWIAGRIYRVGILMYGQKVNYKTLWKWIRQS